MAFNINNFRGNLHSKGVARTNLFEAFIFPPSGISGAEVLRYECESVSIPDLGVDTQKIMPHGHGHGLQRPVASNFQQLSCNFIVDGEWNAKNMFYGWMKKVVNYDNADYTSRSDGKLPYEFGFMEEYGGGIEIRVWPDHKEENFYEYRFGNVYPQNIGSITLAWNENDSYMVLPVSFAYNVYSNSTILPQQT